MRKTNCKLSSEFFGLKKIASSSKARASYRWKILDSLKVEDSPKSKNPEIEETSVSHDLKTGHYEYWEKLGHSENYEEVPRGRVLFNKIAGVYFVIAGNYAFSDNN